MLKTSVKDPPNYPIFIKSFLLVGKISSGNYGIAYKARDLDTHEHYIVKIQERST